jgi:Ca-activated chloride channel homolog
MRRAAVFVLLVVTLLWCVPADSFGQGRPRRVDPSQTVPPPTADRPGQTTAPPAGSDGEDTVSLEGALIEVPVVVADRSGKYVPQLRQQDFRVLEDGVEQQVTFFSAERVPIHVAIVMDTSGSTRDTLGLIQEAAIRFIEQLEPGDKVMVVSFANQVIVEQEFTGDRRLLRQAIMRTQPVGSTKLYEAVYLTVAERLRHVDGRKAMVILSDGEDTASRDATADEAINVCSESDVVAYGIRYPESEGTNVYSNPGRFPGGNPNPGPFPPSYPQPRRRQNRPGIRIPGIPWPNNWPLVAPLVEPQFGGRSPGGAGQQLPRMGNSPFMETITSNTGGTLFYADQVNDVSGLLAVIAEELRNVYVIGYGPTNSLGNGGYRRISVQIPRRPELAIRHRLGYQAEAYK